MIGIGTAEILTTELFKAVVPAIESILPNMNAAKGIFPIQDRVSHVEFPQMHFDLVGTGGDLVYKLNGPSQKRAETNIQKDLSRVEAQVTHHASSIGAPDGMSLYGERLTTRTSSTLRQQLTPAPTTRTSYRAGSRHSRSAIQAYVATTRAPKTIRRAGPDKTSASVVASTARAMPQLMAVAMMMAPMPGRPSRSRHKLLEAAA